MTGTPPRSSERAKQLALVTRAHRRRTGRGNPDHALEAAVLLELERRGREATYVRPLEGYEVDFLARDATGETELIQVCADLSDPATATRECRALAAAGKLFPRARRRLLTLTQDGMPTEPPAGLEMHRACEWLLEGAR